MSILGEESLSYRRPAAGTVGSDGRYVRGSYSTGTILGSVQPLNDDDVQSLPEGERSRRGWCVLTESEILIVDLTDQTLSDHLLIDGTYWEVRAVSRERSILPHYRVIALAIQETGA